jgi:mitochondrial fission protein ELM1
MAAPPNVWVLYGKGTGGNGQMRSLADALAWPYEIKQLVCNRLEALPGLLLGASLLSLDRKRSDPLEPPWPDLVIAASRRSVPVARWIKKKSGGRTRLVHLLHAQAPLALFDLVITTPQYCLPRRPNVLHNVAPLNRLPPERLAAAASEWAPRLARLPRPYTALLAGGNSSSYELEPPTAQRLGREASRGVRRDGGSLLLSTSPRTPPEAAEALIAAIDCPAHVYRWRPGDPANPYHAYLALADRFVVTVDSASQAIEACATGRPVELFEWPERRRSRLSATPILRRWAAVGRAAGASRADATAARFYDALLDWGFLKPPRDFRAYHQALFERGLLVPMGAPAAPSRRPLDDMERAVARVRSLFAEPPAAAPVGGWPQGCGLPIRIVQGEPWEDRA